jgi:hypothetical protein
MSGMTGGAGGGGNLYLGVNLYNLGKRDLIRDKKDLVRELYTIALCRSPCTCVCVVSVSVCVHNHVFVECLSVCICLITPTTHTQGHLQAISCFTAHTLLHSLFYAGSSSDNLMRQPLGQLPNNAGQGTLGAGGGGGGDMLNLGVNLQLAGGNVNVNGHRVGGGGGGWSTNSFLSALPPGQGGPGGVSFGGSMGGQPVMMNNLLFGGA